MEKRDFEESKEEVEPRRASLAHSLPSLHSADPLNAFSLPIKNALSAPSSVIHRSILIEVLHRDLRDTFEAPSVPLPQTIEASLLETQTLDLSFQSLLHIDHLPSFHHLTRLSLDNNGIRKIEKLDALVHLTWLDLSFNQLSVIEGLENLHRLTDLSLAHNQIEALQGLDHVKASLQCLSLNDNAIHDLNSIKSLRSFSQLRVFSLKANPCFVANPEDYYLTIHAFLPQLTYLDYNLIDAEAVKKARDNKLDQLLILEQQEAVDSVNEQEKTKALRRKEANVQRGITNIESLFDTLINTDNDLAKMRVFPVIDDLIKQYEREFIQVIANFESRMAELSAAKQNEEELMNEAMLIVLNRADEDSRKVMKLWRQIHKRYMQMARHLLSTPANGDVRDVQNQDSLTHALSTLHTTLQSSCLELASIEALRVTCGRDLHAELERTLSELSKNSLTEAQQHFRQLMGISAAFSQQSGDSCHALQTAIAVDADSVNGEMRSLLLDKDALATMLSSSRDHHDSLILAREDEIREREESSLKSRVAAMRAGDMDSNRQRQSELNEWRKRQESELSALVSAIVKQEEEDEQI